MTSQPAPFLALVHARDALVAAVAALPAAALEARVPWAGADAPLGWALLSAGAHNVEHRLAIEQQLEALGWRRSEAIRHLADAPVSRRRIEALLVGVAGDVLDREPGPGAWSARQMVEHVIATDRRYWLQARHAADRGDDDPLRPADDLLPARVPPPVLGEPAGALVARLRETHVAALDALVGLRDEQLRRPTDWAGSRQEVAFRLHRFAEHYDEHVADLDGTLAAIGVSRTMPARIAAARLAELGALEAALLRVPAALIDAPGPARAPGGAAEWSVHEQLDHLAAEDRDLLERVRSPGA